MRGKKAALGTENKKKTAQASFEVEGQSSVAEMVNWGATARDGGQGRS